jgi:hypothetical protein
MENIESVNNLRVMIARKENPVKKCPGVYCWWFKKDAIPQLLNDYYKIDTCKLRERTINGEVYCALYFGISKNMMQRAKWHICQRHNNSSNSSVKSGYLSTLRQTLSALLRKKMTESEEYVNCFMNENCYWEWEYTEDTIKIEHNELTHKDYSYPLNIQGNRTVSKEWLKFLMSLRKEYRE